MGGAKISQRVGGGASVGASRKDPHSSLTGLSNGSAATGSASGSANAVGGHHHGAAYNKEGAISAGDTYSNRIAHALLKVRKRLHSSVQIIHHSVGRCVHTLKYII